MKLDLHEKLLVWRYRKGLTITELSEASGVHKDAICRMEKSGVTPNVATVEKLCRGLGIETTALDDEYVVQVPSTVVLTINGLEYAITPPLQDQPTEGGK